MTRVLQTRVWSAFGMLMVSGMLLGGASGCGALSAMANPKVAFAVSEPAPLPVVVRRATTAQETADNVDRLLVATAVDDDSAWLKKLSFTKDEAREAMDQVKARGIYATGPAKVLPSEAWSKLLGKVQSEESTYPNMLTMVSPELGASYGRIIQMKKQVAALEGQLKEAEKKADEAKSDAEKEAYEKAIEKLEAKIDKAKEQIEPLEESFLEKAKANAAKSRPEVREKLGQALVNLRQAVDDAQVANGAAVVRYPMAIPGIKTDVQKVVPEIVADIIEEQTGARPSLKGLQPDVALDGSNVKLKLNGLTDEDLGHIQFDELLSQTLSRTTDWVGKTFALLGTTSSTAGVLSFQADTLDAIQEGFAEAGWKAPAPLVIAE